MEADTRGPLRVDRVEWLVLGANPLTEWVVRTAAPARVRLLADPDDLAGALAAAYPDLVLLSLPPARSSEVALVAQERGRHPALRAVLLAPEHAMRERLEALELGFDEAFDDRILPAELAARLRLLTLRRVSRPQVGMHITVAAGLELDVVMQNLRRGDRTVHLRPKEVRLLQLMASHPGRVFTREQLLERVWGSNHVGGSRTVDVHVRWLREKIEANPHEPVLLQTVRGVGYRFEPAAR